MNTENEDILNKEDESGDEITNPYISILKVL